MSKFTNFLNLFKWNPIDNSEEEFDIDKALNENWDKIDTKLKDYITDTDNNINTLKTSKQDKLTEGNNITISNNTISAKDTTYSTATSSTDGLMSKTDKSKLDGLSNYNDTTIKNEISTLKTSKQDKLIAGTNITISNNTISAKSTTSTTYSTATSSADGLMSKTDKSKLDNIFNSIYPVGSIYMSVNSTSPATLFGGTWEQIKDRFLLACGSTYKAGSTGGSVTHTITVANLPAHAHTYSNATAVQGHTLTINEMPKHNHKQFATANPNTGGFGIRGTFNGTEGHGLSGYDTGVGTELVGGNQAHSHGLTKANANTSSVGSETALNTMPPYLTVYMWKRTA